MSPSLITSIAIPAEESPALQNLVDEIKDKLVQAAEDIDDERINENIKLVKKEVPEIISKSIRCRYE